MHGSSYIWGFLVPASILLFMGFFLSVQLSGAIKLTAALQVDLRSRNKIIKRRGLQISLFFKVSLTCKISIYRSSFKWFPTKKKAFSLSQTFPFRPLCDKLNHNFNLSVSVTILIKISSTSNEKEERRNLIPCFWLFKRRIEARRMETRVEGIWCKRQKRQFLEIVIKAKNARYWR